MDLELAAEQLRRAAPREWAKFIEEFSKETQSCMISLLGAPPDALQLAQGRARENARLLDLFVNCEKAVQKRESKI